MANTLDLSGPVRELMYRRRARQQDIAALLGISPTALSDRMRGRTPWRLEEFVRIAELLGVSIAELPSSEQDVA